MTLGMQQIDTLEDTHGALQWSKPVSEHYSKIISEHISFIMSTNNSADTTEPILIELSDELVLFCFTFINFKECFVYRRKVTVLVQSRIWTKFHIE
jgi:hypothetical protein